MRKTDFKDYLCRPFCMFFAEDEKEEMACLAARVVAALVQGEKILPGQLVRLEKDRSVWEARKAQIGARVCRVCEFREEDCDFQSPAPADDLEPCGGYVVLAWLMENGLIDENDLGKGP